MPRLGLARIHRGGIRGLQEEVKSPQLDPRSLSQLGSKCLPFATSIERLAQLASNAAVPSRLFRRSNVQSRVLRCPSVWPRPPQRPDSCPCSAANLWRRWTKYHCRRWRRRRWPEQRWLQSFQWCVPRRTFRLQRKQRCPRPRDAEISPPTSSRPSFLQIETAQLDKTVVEHLRSTLPLVEKPVRGRQWSS